MNLSEHFTLEELTNSSTAIRLGIDNTPSPSIAANLTRTAMQMESVRTLLGFPIQVNSGYRCPDLNKAIGGAKDSAHMSGYAIDFVCPQYGNPDKIVKAIRFSGIPFDQLIQEGTWVHISFDPQMRNEVLTAHFSNGSVTYTRS